MTDHQFHIGDVWVYCTCGWAKDRRWSEGCATAAPDLPGPHAIVERWRGHVQDEEDIARDLAGRYDENRANWG